MTRDDPKRVDDIIEAAEHVQALVDRGRAAFDEDVAVRLAIERLLEILGEAANSVTDATRSQFPAVPWADMSRLRILLAHHYHRIDPNQVWTIAADEVPELLRRLRPAQ